MLCCNNTQTFTWHYPSYRQSTSTRWRGTRLQDLVTVRKLPFPHYVISG